MFPLHSSCDAVVEHALLCLWKTVRSASRATGSASIEAIPASVWTSVANLLLHKNPDIRVASGSALLAFATKSATMALQLCGDEKILHCICLHLVSTHEAFAETEVIVVTQILHCFAKIEALAPTLSNCGVIDACSYLILHPAYTTENGMVAQAIAMRVLDALLRWYPPSFEDMETGQLFSTIFRRLQCVDPLSAFVEASLGLLHRAMESQPLLVCELAPLVPWLVLQLGLPYHQYRALCMLRIFLRHTISPPHLSTSASTLTILRTTGGLIDLSWLATCHRDSSVTAAATAVWAAIRQLDPSDRAFVVDVVEQGCAVLACTQSSRRCEWRWLIKALDEDHITALLETVIVTTNVLLQRNIILTCLVAAALDTTMAKCLIANDMVGVLHTALTVSAKQKRPQLLLDLCTAIRYFCKMGLSLNHAIDIDASNTSSLFLEATIYGSPAAMFACLDRLITSATECSAESSDLLWEATADGIVWITQNLIAQQTVSN
ncbi:hypothetical protein ACHHYP_20460 [Achlya hypogyna]|uniref:DUF3730 domain-containing protein n=1 Tax=Achlya hypogyna TaxID=1202772 RepID=A0A1V9ZID2_ACHHY|nr:hypothetical protein ACHHYP_20460 [Achlya hypogyna]